VVRWWQLTSFEHKFRKRQYWGYVDEVCISDTGDKYGELEFCEAVKVNVSKTKEATFQASITNTCALLSAIFDDFGVAVEVHEGAKTFKKSEVEFPSGYSILFNKNQKPS
jgi:hypothetical protein